MSETPDRIEPPAALVLGCNTPHGIGVLSDWIGEQTGHAPDFHGAGWSEGKTFGNGGNAANEGNGFGDGLGYGNGNGDGRGDAIGKV